MGKIKALVTEMGNKGAEEFLARIRENLKRNKKGKSNEATTKESR